MFIQNLNTVSRKYRYLQLGIGKPQPNLLEAGSLAGLPCIQGRVGASYNLPYNPGKVAVALMGLLRKGVVQICEVQSWLRLSEKGDMIKHNSWILPHSHLPSATHGEPPTHPLPTMKYIPHTLPISPNSQASWAHLCTTPCSKEGTKVLCNTLTVMQFCNTEDCALL